jgi:hypothetical protein
MADATSRKFVIDASLAFAADPTKPDPDPDALCVSQFLTTMEMLAISSIHDFYAVIDYEIADEWDMSLRRQLQPTNPVPLMQPSPVRFAHAWRTRMEANGRIVAVSLGEEAIAKDVCTKIWLGVQRFVASRQGTESLELFKKDFPLIKMAVATGGAIVSQDKKAGRAFRRAAKVVAALFDIVWVHLAARGSSVWFMDGEQAEHWLRSGAPALPELTLGYRRSSR